jgi:hypothetical protein
MKIQACSGRVRDDYADYQQGQRDGAYYSDPSERGHDSGNYARLAQASQTGLCTSAFEDCARHTSRISSSFVSNFRARARARSAAHGFSRSSTTARTRAVRVGLTLAQEAPLLEVELEAVKSQRHTARPCHARAQDEASRRPSPPLARVSRVLSGWCSTVVRDRTASRSTPSHRHPSPTSSCGDPSRS